MKNIEVGECFTVGVNDVCGLIHLNYLVLQNYDYQMPKRQWDIITAATSDFICSPFLINEISERSNFVHLPPGKKGGTALGDDGRIDYTNTSVYMAVCLAVFLGASSVGLIGVDFSPGRFSGGSDKHPLEDDIVEISSEFEALAKAMYRRGICLVNLSSISKIEVLPYLNPREYVSGGKLSNNFNG